MACVSMNRYTGMNRHAETPTCPQTWAGHTCLQTPDTRCGCKDMRRTDMNTPKAVGGTTRRAHMQPLPVPSSQVLWCAQAGREIGNPGPSQVTLLPAGSLLSGRPWRQLPVSLNTDTRVGVRQGPKSWDQRMKQASQLWRVPTLPGPSPRLSLH